MRTGLVLDPGGGLLKQLMLPFKLGLGGPLAGGSQYMPWIHRDDEIGLMLWALDNPQARGVYNATAPNPVTNTEFSKALGTRDQTAVVHAGAEVRDRGAARLRADRADRRQHARRAKARARRSATSFVIRRSSRRCATSSAESRLGHLELGDRARPPRAELVAAHLAERGFTNRID